uniref:Uncharacterized protein n=1 Tax=Oryza meridionalis TaxID=40149 RepID=A0A0E0CHF3_9ORYZ
MGQLKIKDNQPYKDFLVPQSVEILDTLGTTTGNRSISSIHGFFFTDSSSGFTDRSALHTALLHLNPDPNAICHTLSLLLTLPFASLYASSYHSELLDVVIRDGSICHSPSDRFFSISSSTALPPACTQKCSNASLKSGM